MIAPEHKTAAPFPVIFHTHTQTQPTDGQIVKIIVDVTSPLRVESLPNITDDYTAHSQKESTHIHE